MSQATLLDPRKFLARKSFIELNARERAQALMDEGTYRELLGPFDRLESPWLPMQGVVPQADDGLIVARGRIGGKDSVILAIEGQFQGGSAGEVSGAKMTVALDLAREDAEKGKPIQAVLLLETGGVRLQEANLGLEAIAEINSSLVALRRHVPVLGVIAGMVGCFGGMSITASLCSYLKSEQLSPSLTYRAKPTAGARSCSASFLPRRRLRMLTSLLGWQDIP